MNRCILCKNLVSNTNTINLERPKKRWGYKRKIVIEKILHLNQYLMLYLINL